MGRLFEELDNQSTPLGELSLRRRRIPALGDEDIYEVKLGEEFLMSSLFVEAEEALAERGLNTLEREQLEVVVGGLGLGHTAKVALQDSRVSELLVVEALPPVIQWHKDGLVPLGETLTNDRRCHLVEGNFFQLALDPARGFDPDHAGRQFDAILLDIDHSPRAVLASDNTSFYTPATLKQLTQQLKPGGVFAMWSNEPPDPDFLETLETAFPRVLTEIVSFFNPFQNNQASATLYIAKL